MPERIVSASHLCAHSPDSWAFVGSNDPDALRRAEAANLGLDAERMDAVVMWASEMLKAHDAIAWPHVFFSLAAARQFAEQFLPPNHDLVLIGLGIEPRYVKSIQDALGPGRAGFWAAIDRMIQLASGGEPLGFELLGSDGTGAHSWLCNGVERGFHEVSGVRPNLYGLLATAADADSCLAYIGADSLRAEPVPWFPWLLVRYPL